MLIETESSNTWGIKLMPLSVILLNDALGS